MDLSMPLDMPAEAWAVEAVLVLGEIMLSRSIFIILDFGLGFLSPSVLRRDSSRDSSAISSS